MTCLCKEKGCCPEKDEEVIELLAGPLRHGAMRFNTHAIRRPFSFHQTRACLSDLGMYVQHSNVNGYHSRIVDHRTSNGGAQ